MNRHAANQTNAIRTVVAYLYIAANVTITNAITAFAAVLLSVKNKLILIDSYDSIVTSTTKGVTIDTKAVRGVMESIAFKCSRAIIAYASQAPIDNALIAKAKYSKSQLKKIKKEDIAAVCEVIRKAASDNITDLADYGISATDVSDLAAAIALYLSANSNPRQATINKNVAIRQINQLIKEINQDLFPNQLDNLVLTLEASQSEFVAKYFEARVIIDLGKSHTKIKGTIVDKSGNPIPYASVKAMKTGTTTIDYLIKTNALGVIPNTYILPGDYDLLVEARGFISFTEISVHFSPGATIKRDFVLSPI